MEHGASFEKVLEPAKIEPPAEWLLSGGQEPSFEELASGNLSAAR